MSCPNLAQFGPLTSEKNYGQKSGKCFSRKVTERKWFVHLAESLCVDHKAVVTLGAVLYTGANLPPPVDGTFDAVTDRRPGTSAAADVTRLATARPYTQTWERLPYVNYR